MKKYLAIVLTLLIFASASYSAEKQYVALTLAYSATRNITATVRGDALYYMTATGNCALTMTGGVRGDSVTFFITSDSAPRVMTFGTGFTSAGTLTLVASQTSVLRFTYTGTTWKEEYRANGTSSGVSLTTGVSGVLPIANGGTNKSSWTQWGIPYADTTASLAQIGAGSAGQVLQSNGNAAQTWSTPTYPSASQTAGKILRSDGTNIAATTSTFADTYAINTILYNASANTVSGLATGNSGVLVTSAGGVPSIATDIPTAVTIGSKYVYRAEGTDIPVADGGTGLSSFVQGDVPYASATTTISTLAKDTTATRYISNQGTSNNPSWNQVNLANGVTGTLAATNGGTPATRVIELYRSTYRPSPDGTSNSGILSDIYDITNYVNFTRWTSGSATQDYNVWYEFTIPTDWVSFPTNAFSISVRSNDFAGNTLTATMYDSGNAIDTGISAVSIAPSQSDVWQTKTDTPDTPTTPYAAGQICHIKIFMLNDEASNTVDIAKLFLTYNTR